MKIFNLEQSKSPLSCLPHGSLSGQCCRRLAVRNSREASIFCYSGTFLSNMSLIHSKTLVLPTLANEKNNWKSLSLIFLCFSFVFSVFTSLENAFDAVPWAWHMADTVRHDLPNHVKFHDFLHKHQTLCWQKLRQIMWIVQVILS